ncbi:alpha/beta fold hydrolase [bacterium AH-315-A03]|nr:alpha/beta fold hydrolase [bacterium AH-315-A03]
MLTAINGKELWLETSGEGDPVVMVHGLGGTSTFFDAVATRLASSSQVVVFDLEGHGRSPLAGSLSISGWAEDLGAVLDHVGASSASVVSHSMGTVIAQEFAARNPDRVDKLVLLGPIRELPDGGRDGLCERAATVREHSMGAVATGIANGGTGPRTKESRPEVVGYVRESLLRQDSEGYAAACEALAASVDADQAAISCPVLLITGTDDGLAPPDKAERISAGFADSRLEVIDGIGHWTVIEAGTEVAALVADFLS